MTNLQTRSHVDSGGADCGCGGPLYSGLGALLPVPDAGAGSRRPQRMRTGTTVFVGATVLPVDDAFSEAEALAIRDGRIIAVGTEADVREAAGDDAEVIDRTGSTILPGFIEPHAHLLPTALLDTFTDVGPFSFDTVDGAVAHLRESVAATPPGSWIRGRQFDPSLQSGPDELTTEMLDTVSDVVPVVVMNASGHFAYANSAALAAAGIDRDTPDIEGSPYGRYADGAPNGVLMGQGAILSVMAANPALGDLDILAEARKVADRAASNGVTTICDQGTGFLLGAGDIDLFESLAAAGLPTRLRYSLYDNRGDGFDQRGTKPGDGDEYVRATGWKIVSDGSNQGRTGSQREPYLGTDDRGLPYVEPDDLVAKARLRASQGWQVVIHANGDRAIDIALDAQAAAVEAGGPDRRHRIEHCSILHDEQITRIAELGLSPSFLIGHVHFWGKAFRDEIFGPDKAAKLDRTASCSAAGIRWTIHSDEMVTPMEPLRCIHNAVTRELWREPGSILNADECVPVEAAIRAMTADAAWQCHSDHEIGTLEPGKCADFVVLADNPRTVDPRDLASIGVLETWMDGERRH
ncbi:amidohydrolase [Actinospongicola halichondriae]|uniref:amidohydrolase n=1 Tax=Actinospongicola halichondriae TaxID=3236844 RepID=UPI003D579670